jgi:hypothetical protein
MTTVRKNHTPTLKRRLRWKRFGNKINQNTAEFGVHATRVNNWKKMATDAIAQAFVGEEG